MREITALADRTNHYIDEHEPWKHAKDPSRSDHVQGVCSLGINAFRVLMVYLKPILPAMATKAEAFLNIEELTWNDVANPLLDHSIGTFRPLLTRIDRNDVDRVVEATKAESDDQ